MLQDVSPYLALASTVVVAILIGLVVWLTLSLRRLQTGQRAVLGPYGRRDVVEHIAALEDQVRNLRDAVEILTSSVEEYRHDLDRSLSNYAIVRYDAFMDPGGQQSASVALLDNYRSGLTLSLLASRDTAHLYVKHLDHGTADRQLSPEEEEAVRRAVPQPLPADVLSGRPLPTLLRRLPVWTPGDSSEEPPAANPLQETLDLTGETPLPAAQKDEDTPERATANAGRAPRFTATTDELEAAESPMPEEPASSPRRERDDWLGGEDLDF